ARLSQEGVDGPRPVDLPLHRQAARGRAHRPPAGRRRRGLPAEAARPGERAMNERTTPRGRVLVVEDEAYVRDSLVEMLGSRGFQVAPAASVAEALTALSRSPVDVVLSDLKMPGADGLELVKRMQASWPEIPVVLL